MKCPKCGFEEVGTSKFCGNCGASLADVVIKTEEVKDIAAEKPVAAKSTEGTQSEGGASKFMPNSGAVNIGNASEDIKPDIPSTPLPGKGMPMAAPIVTSEPNKNDKKASKIAEKEAKKQSKAQAKTDAKNQKSLEKAELEQSKLEACPKCYKPKSTSFYFWFMLINAIPVLGLVVSFFASIISPNRNVKRFERAAFFWNLILLVIIGLVVCVGIFYFNDDNIYDILYDIGDAFGF